jgi:predicted  nucleic acid-binding Zn-ribbon protein
MGLIMTQEEAIKRIEALEEEMRLLKWRVSTMMEQLDEVDDRTRQFKKFTQTSHPDFDLGA